MGYESKLYVVRKSKNFYGEDKRYGEKIAEFDMCKFYALSDKLRKQPNTDCYVYADDGNTRIIEDCYGEELTEATPKFVIDVLEKILADGEDYWRIYPLLAFLKSLVEQKIWQSENIVVLHYGH